MTPSPGIEPGPHWWEASALTTAPPQHPNEQLDSKVSAFLNEHGCLVGTSMVLGHLRSEGLNIQRERVRKCLARVDPRNVRIRWAITVSRRAYSVAGPNSLWHLDGHHSLITWGFVIHGAIDGFSRLVTFLHCSTNNRSGTVADLFLNARLAIKGANRPRRREHASLAANGR